MGFFTGVSGIARNQSNAKGEYFKDGKYLIEINKLEAKERRSDGQAMAIVEGYVIEVLNSEGISNAEGQKVSWFNDLSRKPDDKLTDRGERGLGRIKTFIAELLGGDAKGVKDEDITEKICEQLFGVSKGFTGEETKGQRLIAEAKTTVSPTTNKPFTNVYWRALDA